MNILKTLVKFAFLGGFFAACLGLFVGGVILPPVLWPHSNLGPLAGVIYGVPIGTVSGAVFGLLFGIVRILWAKRRPVHGKFPGLNR